MPLSRFWSVPANATNSVNSGDVVQTSAPAGGPGYNAGLDSLQVPQIITAPPSSASVYAPASYTANTASVATVVQNTLGYDAMFTAYFQGAASVGTFQVGVGPTSSVAMTTVSTGITAATVQAWDFPAYVPSGYYFSFQVGQANAASVPSAALTIVATPV